MARLSPYTRYVAHQIYVISHQMLCVHKSALFEKTNQHIYVVLAVYTVQCNVIDLTKDPQKYPNRSHNVRNTSEFFALH